MTASMSGSIANKGKSDANIETEADKQDSHVLRTTPLKQLCCKCAEVQRLNGEHMESEST